MAKAPLLVPSNSWSGQRDSNPRVSAWEADALPLGDARVCTPHMLVLRKVYRASFRGTRHRRANGRDRHEYGSRGNHLDPAHVAVRELSACRRYVPDIEIEGVRRGRVPEDDRDGLDVLSVGEVEGGEGVPERIGLVPSNPAFSMNLCHSLMKELYGLIASSSATTRSPSTDLIPIPLSRLRFRSSHSPTASAV